MNGVTPTHSLDGARALITGGLGFIGSNLARRLVQLGVRVTVVDSLVPEYGGNLANIRGIEDRIRVNISDVRDPYGMRVLIDGQDFLFNLAGQTSHVDSMSDPETDLEINVRSQLSILETIRRHNPGLRVVFASTRQIYGRPQYLPVDERHPIRPVDVNGIHKAAAEWYHLLYHDVYSIKTSVLRLTNTYGPGMRVKDARQTFVGIWIAKVLDAEPFEVWGGDQLRDFTFVDDAVDAFIAAATDERADGEVFNLGGDRVVSLRELADLLIAAAGQGEYVIREYPAERMKIDIGDYYSDDRSIRDRLGWSPQTSLEDGLRRTLEYYRTHMDAYR